MAEPSLWHRYQSLLVADPALGLRLDVSRVRFPDGYLDRMAGPIGDALEAMAKLEAGAVANADENRMVGHYWLRDPALAPTPEIRFELETGLANIERFAQATHASQWIRHVLHVGIGGSALGPQFLAEALAPADAPLDLHFLDNTDPDGFDRVLGRLAGKLDRTMVVVVSKSGGTPEPANGLAEARAAFAAAGLPFAKHAVAVTMPGSKLDKVAESEEWAARFPMQDWIGGRTSIMSAVGLLPAALLGIDVRALLAGAKAMDAWTRGRDFRQNPAAMLALMWHHLGGGKGQKDMVVLPYKDRLVLFSKYLQQLVMESLGKERDRQGRVVHQGIAVYGNKGSTDQHAYVQQLRDGVPNFFATFIEVLQNRDGASIDVEPGVTAGDYLHGFLHGTRRALYENGRDSITITINKVTPESVGALVALYERAVGLYAELIDTNAYHQPGVEAGKKAAAEVLTLKAPLVAALKGESGLTAEAVAQKIGRPDDAEAVYAMLEHLAANAGTGVVRAAAGGPGEARFAGG